MNERYTGLIMFVLAYTNDIGIKLTTKYVTMVWNNKFNCFSQKLSPSHSALHKCFMFILRRIRVINICVCMFFVWFQWQDSRVVVDNLSWLLVRYFGVVHIICLIHSRSITVQWFDSVLTYCPLCHRHVGQQQRISTPVCLELVAGWSPKCVWGPSSLLLLSDATCSLVCLSSACLQVSSVGLCECCCWLLSSEHVQSTSISFFWQLFSCLLADI